MPHKEPKPGLHICGCLLLGLGSSGSLQECCLWLGLAFTLKKDDSEWNATWLLYSEHSHVSSFELDYLVFEFSVQEIN